MIKPVNRPLLFLLLLTIAWTGSGCELLSSDEDSPDVTGIIVANGGNFSDQNGFLTAVDPATRATSESMDMQGFVQAVELHDGDLYVLINTFGEGRVDVLDPASLQRTGQWAGLTAPRDVAILNGTAWVSGFVFGAAGVVTPVDMETATAGTPIAVPDVPEGILTVGSRLFVASNGSLGAGSTVTVIEGSSRTVQQTVDIGCDGPRDLYMPENGVVAVVCTGRTEYNDDFSQVLDRTNGAVVFLDAASLQVTSRIELPAQAGATNGTETAAFSDETGELFVTMAADNRIAVIDTDERSLSSVIDVPARDGRTGLSGISYDPESEHILVARFAAGAGGFPDYAARGVLVWLERDGSVVYTAPVGPSPSEVLILTDE